MRNIIRLIISKIIEINSQFAFVDIFVLPLSHASFIDYKRKRARLFQHSRRYSNGIINLDNAVLAERKLRHAVHIN